MVFYRFCSVISERFFQQFLKHFVVDFLCSSISIIICYINICCTQMLCIYIYILLVARLYSINTSTDVISMCVVPIKVKYGNSGKILETHTLLDSCYQSIFILERLINNLGVKKQKTSITINILHGEVINKAIVERDSKQQVVMVIQIISWNIQIHIPRSTYQLTKKMLQHLQS